MGKRQFLTISIWLNLGGVALGIILESDDRKLGFVAEKVDEGILVSA
ncbi:hypothetical protein [Pseudomonas sp. MUP55]|nr:MULTISPECIES: hypothetical protein [unclassified Pseudomonas]WPN94325.1 hypothetical protein SC319_08090 [Pseudomonas sp. MUP56]WPN99852.1 hypothetical protein SC318_08090 [Pseudomonas sp. MUP55]